MSHRNRSTYNTIDAEISAEIERLHTRHPELGHDGIEELLTQSGRKIDPSELRKFMARNKLSPGPTARATAHDVARRSWLP
jgi:hypothetical protein